MYKFKEVQKLKRDKLGIKITVGEKYITLWKDYRKLHSKELYARIYFDKTNKALGLKFTISKEENAFYIRDRTIINSKMLSFFEVEQGVYDFKETTNEDIDVFIKLVE